MATLTEALELAIQHHKAGRLNEAGGVYQNILSALPGQPEAQHLFACLCYQANRQDLIPALGPMTPPDMLAPADAHRIGLQIWDTAGAERALPYLQRAADGRPDSTSELADYASALSILGQHTAANMVYAHMAAAIRGHNAREPVRSFSQFGEDQILYRLFRDIPFGRFADVGAHHPVQMSNTYGLYTRGWRGVCLEPHPKLNALFQTYRPEDVCLDIAASDKDGEMEFFHGEHTVHSSLKRSFIHTTSTPVQVRRLETVLDELNFPHEFELLSIDTEGTEINVLLGLNLEKYRPRVIISEVDTAGKMNYELMAFLPANGYYVIWQNGTNVIASRFFREDYNAALN
ncbi:FkbM family methyltransferase [Azospirillum fermentarium]|uniref:FkbM family methyltransferase n=1 Tax=Azospirillum fermentarium TaxID=1233114 RepID=UPI00222648B8|nr:FkbM family methyltransferase [Azospirillum fermentarium]MCW2245810.1 FkbM family methyltransferase [Azospirillum fermentarium]